MKVGVLHTEAYTNPLATEMGGRGLPYAKAWGEVGGRQNKVKCGRRVRSKRR